MAAGSDAKSKVLTKETQSTQNSKRAADHEKALPSFSIVATKFNRDKLCYNAIGASCWSDKLHKEHLKTLENQVKKGILYT